MQKVLITISRTFLLLVCFGLLSVAAGQDLKKPARLQLTPCQVPRVTEKVLCGTYEVFEDRAARKGRKITIKVVVFPATGPERAPDPLVYIPGGPGSSATEDAPGIAQVFAGFRAHRDMVFIDQRGTGGSHPLNCVLFDPDNPQSYLGHFFPLADVRKCRQELEPKANLKLYTTPIAMDDFNEVRAALGYERLNLFGTSYGTRAALVYLKRHPHSVRTVSLHGVAPTNQFMPRDFAAVNERALQGIISECAADESCNKAFPNLREETRSVLERLIKGPVETKVSAQSSATVPGAAAPPTLTLSRDLAAEAIRYMLYSPRGASRVPLFIHLAAQGNFTPLAQSALQYRQQLVATGSNGLYLSITCAEDLPWIKPGEGERLSENTFLGDYRLRQQREACALWPRATIPKDYSQPTKSDAPVLILTGEWDPVTPPAHGDAVAKHLPNSLHIVVPDGAHGFGGLQGNDCILRLQTAFVERGTTKGLDTSCIKNVKRSGFDLTLPPPRQ